MAEPFNIAGGKWLKFDQYELREGCIAPVRRAKMSIYDPWKLRARPYEALAELVPSIKVLTLPRQNPALVAGVIDWCNRYGLLGTLLHRVIAVTFPARWKRVEFAHKEQRDIFTPEQYTRVHVPGGWLARATVFASCVSKDPSQVGAPVSPEVLPAEAQPPGALVIDLPGVTTAGGLVKQEPLDKTWGEHFPDVPFGERATYDYPAPPWEEFFAVYGEPLIEFLEAAWLLTSSMDAVSQPRDAHKRVHGISLLTQLAALASPSLERHRDGSLHQRWVSGSLLSSLAMMAMEDLASDRLHRCATCRRFFLSSAHQVEYCSPKCRHTMQKRRFRAKHPHYERHARRRRVEQKES